MICPCCGQPFEDIDRLIDFIIFGPVARRLAHVLAQNRGTWLRRERLIDLVYGDRSDGGPNAPDEVIDVIFCEIRDKLAPYGVILEGTYKPGGGRRMQ